MKILHITQGTIGGTLEYLKLLLIRLNKKGIHSQLICPSYGPMKKDIENLGIKVYEVDMKREISLFADIKSMIYILKIIKTQNYDIVHLHSSKAGALGRIICFFHKIPCVYTPHGWAFNIKTSRAKQLIYANIEKFLSLFTKYIINISKYEYVSAVKNKIANEQKLKLINNGIDIEKYKHVCVDKIKFKESLKVPKETILIGMVGRITEQKDPISFVKMARKIINRGHNVHFILVGDGELRKEVENEINHQNLNKNITITGWIDQVGNYVKCFDIGILTSKWEGFGLVLAEYMASKVPVVASNVDGIPNVIIDGKTGILVEAGDIDGFADAIIRLIEDRTLYRQFVENGFQRVVSKFNIDRVVDEHVQMYKQILRDGKCDFESNKSIS
ncbi:glycosyltransferase family 4 protein [Crassaminicella profunda]|uniref:glycosyltransferase family 4 protein n=1 Tax=Crassaminicella profunda TaxID=1286698 RepID=UPI001CA692A3|nr:glycosyltransferase family 4 protein [Crassaminicella profunda]QZY55342.1 glycosyltransferase family 4 protein [Crassaminicella profunda]